MSAKIAFVGLVVRMDDGKTVAFDLEGTDLSLKVDVRVPQPPHDVTEFGHTGLCEMEPPDRVEVTITGHRLAGAEKLLTQRKVTGGEPPFAAWTAEGSDSDSLNVTMNNSSGRFTPSRRVRVTTEDGTVLYEGPMAEWTVEG